MEASTGRHFSRRGATWLNGGIWVCIVGAFGYILVLQDYRLSLPFLYALALISVGLVSNLLVCLWLAVTGRGREAKPYLLSLIPLVVAGVGVCIWVFFFDPYDGC